MAGDESDRGPNGPAPASSSPRPLSTSLPPLVAAGTASGRARLTLSVSAPAAAPPPATALGPEPPGLHLPAAIADVDADSAHAKRGLANLTADSPRDRVHDTASFIEAGSESGSVRAARAAAAPAAAGDPMVSSTSESSWLGGIGGGLHFRTLDGLAAMKLERDDSPADNGHAHASGTSLHAQRLPPTAAAQAAAQAAATGRSREHAARKELAMEAVKKYRSAGVPRMRLGAAGDEAGNEEGGEDGEAPDGGAEGEKPAPTPSVPRLKKKGRMNLVVLIALPICTFLLVSNVIVWYLGFNAVQRSIGDIVGVLQKDLLSKAADGSLMFLDGVAPALSDLQAQFRAGLLTTSRTDPNTHPWALRMVQSWPQFAVCGAGFEDDWYWSMTVDDTDPANLRTLYLRVLYDSKGVPVLASFPTDAVGKPVGDITRLDDPNIVRRTANFKARERLWYKQWRAVGGSAAVWSPSYFKTEGQLSMAIAAPLYDPAGTLVGVGHCVVELERGFTPIIQRIVSAYSSMTVAFVVEGGAADYLVTSSVGRPVMPNPAFSSTNNAIQNGTLANADVRVPVWQGQSPLPGIARCLTGNFGALNGIGRAKGAEQASMTCGVPDFGDAVILASRIQYRGVDWLLVVAIASDRYLDNSRRSSILSGVISGVIFVLAIGISILSALAISRPLQRLAREMELVKTLMFTDNASSRGERGPASRVAEVARLSSAFSSMFQGLRVFAKFVPASVVQKALASRPDNRGTELSLALFRSTIFFVDIRDFTTLSASLPPEKLLEVMSDALSVTSLSIEKNQGTIDKFIGDAVMAFFSCPLAAVEGHERLACEAALECQEALMVMRPSWASRGLPPLECRIGVNSGDCLIGNFGCETRYSYTAVGDTVNAAARLEPLNKRYGTSILISDEVAGKVRDRFFCRLVDIVVLKGRTASTRIYELIARSGTETEAERRYAAAYETAFDLFLRRRFAEAAGRFEACGRLAATVRLERELFELELQEAEQEGAAGVSSRSNRSGRRSGRGGFERTFMSPDSRRPSRPRAPRRIRRRPYPPPPPRSRRPPAPSTNSPLAPSRRARAGRLYPGSPPPSSSPTPGKDPSPAPRAASATSRARRTRARARPGGAPWIRSRSCRRWTRPARRRCRRRCSRGCGRRGRPVRRHAPSPAASRRRWCRRTSPGAS